MAEVMAALAPAHDRILEAAERVVAEVGAAHLTLELVAQAARVSKGGLLYHFPSKEALLTGLAQRYVQSLEHCIDAARDDLQNDAARDAKACIVGMLGQNPRSQAMGAALLAAAASDLTLLDVIRERIEEYTAELAASAKNFPRAAIVALAVDGLKFRESLRMSPFTDEQREAIVKELLKIADEAYR